MKEEARKDRGVLFEFDTYVYDKRGNCIEVSIEVCIEVSIR